MRRPNPEPVKDPLMHSGGFQITLVADVSARLQEVMSAERAFVTVDGQAKLDGVSARLAAILKKHPSLAAHDGDVFSVKDKTNGWVNISGGGGLTGSIGKGEDEIGFGLGRGQFVHVTDLDGKVLWAKSDEPEPEPPAPPEEPLRSLRCELVYTLKEADGSEVELARVPHGRESDGKPRSDRHKYFESTLAAIRAGEKGVVVGYPDKARKAAEAK